MTDQFESRLWADHHDAISGAFAQLIQDIAAAFRVLNAHQYDAPWQKQARPCR